jgi:hypothetical protein
VVAIVTIRMCERVLLKLCFMGSAVLVIFPKLRWYRVLRLGLYPSLAWWVSNPLEDKADVAYTRAVSTGLTNSRIAGEALQRYRRLRAAF